MTATRPCRACGRPFKPAGKAYYCSDTCRCGTDAGYQGGCRCTDCKAAHARNRKRQRVLPTPTVSTVGTVRRLDALACLGWSTAELSRQLGMHRSYLLKVRERATVEQGTARKVAHLYDELCMTLAHTPTANRTAADARARGYAPPLAWDEGTLDDPKAKPHGTASRAPLGDSDVDEAVIDRFLAGEHRIPTTTAERREIARRWVAAGRSLAALGRVTGWKPERYHRTSDQAEAA